MNEHILFYWQFRFRGELNETSGNGDGAADPAEIGRRSTKRWQRRTEVVGRGIILCATGLNWILAPPLSGN